MCFPTLHVLARILVPCFDYKEVKKKVIAVKSSNLYLEASKSKSVDSNLMNLFEDSSDEDDNDDDINRNKIQLEEEHIYRYIDIYISSSNYLGKPSYRMNDLKK
jgi:hypothetical protein